MNEQLLARLQDRLGAVNREYQAFRRQMDCLLRDAVELCKDTGPHVVSAEIRLEEMTKEFKRQQEKQRLCPHPADKTIIHGLDAGGTITLCQQCGLINPMPKGAS